MDRKAVFYPGSPEEDNFIPHAANSRNDADFSTQHQAYQSDGTNDSDIEPSYAPPVVRSPTSSLANRRRSVPVSINADPAAELGCSNPIRARSRIWAAIGIGSLGRDSSYFDDLSKTPHRCQSYAGFPQEQTPIASNSNGRTDYSESYTQSVTLPCGHPQSSAVSRRDRYRQTSVCSITELPSEASSTSVNEISAAEDVSDSTDSHCHSKLQKGGIDKKARTKLILASVLCLMFMTGEMVGGLLAHSLAIISDAAHLLTDFASFMISLMALYLANRPATKKLSFGWYRIEILGAFVSILMLWVLTGILVYSAVLRIMEDNYEIDASVMLITAGTGVAFNIVLGTTLHQHSHSHGGGGHGHSHGGHGHSQGHGSQGQHPRNHQSLTSSPSPARSYGSIRDVESGGGGGGRGSEGHDDPDVDDEKTLLTPHEPDGHGHSHEHKSSNINVKAAFIHVLGDLFQSVGVLVAAFIIFYKPEWKIADPICTFMFSLFVLITTITIMRDILVVLMEGTPRGINFTEVRNTFFQVEGVLDIHNLRVWSLTMDKIALSVHLAVDKKSDPHKVLKMASHAIQQRFNISETTMQIEEYVTEMVDCKDCQGPKL